MDPLSITASSLTIIGTAGVIGRSFKRIIALRHAPAILLELNDEVAGLYCVLQAVDFLIRRHAGIAHDGPMSNLCRALKNAESTLFKLEALVRDKLTFEGRDSEVRLDRGVWLFAASRVGKLKEQIRVDRVELAAALSLLSS